MQTTPTVHDHKIWGHITLWVTHHRSITRLVCLSVGMVLFVVLVPPSTRHAFWDGLFSHKILAGMLFVLSLLAISLVWSTGQQIDSWAFLLLNVRGKRQLWLDHLMLALTEIGNGLYAPIFSLVLFLSGDHLLAFELMLGTLSLWLVVEFIKAMVHRSRPFIRLAQARIVGYRAIGRSFPSGHTSQVFFMATLIINHFHINLWIVLLIYIIAVVVGITRIYVGAHYPRDVLAGAILGSAWGLVGMIIDGYVVSRIG